MQPNVYPEPSTNKSVPQSQNPLGHAAINPHNSAFYDTPEPPVSESQAQASSSTQPMPIVKVLSVRGVEYGMMTIALLISASTLAWVVLNMLNGSRGFDSVVVPTSALVVCLPVLVALFIRLKRAELKDFSLKLDPSKRRWSQLVQFLAFVACLINLIYFVYVILQHTSGGSVPSIAKSLVNLVVVLVIAGGILSYYWFDEHRARRD